MFRTKTTATKIISFPKCGRTWLRLLLSKSFELHVQEQTQKTFLNMEGIGIFFEPLQQKLLETIKGLPEVYFTHDNAPMFKKKQELSHDKSAFKKDKVIFLVRDPRDVVVSCYFEKSKRILLYKDQPVFEGTLHDFLFEKEGSLETIVEYYNIWFHQQHIPKTFKIIKYENLKNDSFNTLHSILSFLGTAEITHDNITRAIEYCSFENMRKLEETDEFQSHRLKPVDVNDTESFKTRKGKVGGYTDYLEKEDIGYMNNYINENLTPELGYQSPT